MRTKTMFHAFTQSTSYYYGILIQYKHAIITKQKQSIVFLKGRLRLRVR